MANSNVTAFSYSVIDAPTQSTASSPNPTAPAPSVTSSSQTQAPTPTEPTVSQTPEPTAAEPTTSQSPPPSGQEGPPPTGQEGPPPTGQEGPPPTDQEDLPVQDSDGDFGENYQITTDSYNFLNERASFGYPEDYSIPYEIFAQALGDEKATAVYDWLSEWIGSCVGMSATSGLFYKDELDLSLYSSESNVFDVSAPRSSTAEITKLIEFYQVLQYKPAIAAAIEAQKGDYAEIIEAVENFEKTGRQPVILCVRGRGSDGHALFPYKSELGSDGYYAISVYDSNIPGVERKLYIKENLREFRFAYDDKPDSEIWSEDLSYVSLDLITENIAQNIISNSAIIISDRDDLVITNSEGTNIYDIPGAFRYYPYDSGTNAAIYYAPSGDYLLTSPGAVKATVNYNGVTLNLSSAAESGALINLEEPFVSLSHCEETDVKLSIQSFNPSVKNYSFEGSVGSLFALELENDNIQLMGNFETR
jgi:hypothetical protein